MQDKDSFLSALLVANPENVFEKPTLSYKSAEIESIIDLLGRASKPRRAYGWAIDLLLATKRFRRATTPGQTFAEIRALAKSDTDFRRIFEDAEHAFVIIEVLMEQPENTSQDKIILDSAKQYCCSSVKNRIASLLPDDKLLIFWQESELKKHLGL